ncbi:MAG: adenine deaminase [Bacteroidetes bacterium]|nr:MAG: adenine deaminase [Bacteroidota bacterium]
MEIAGNIVDVVSKTIRKGVVTVEGGRIASIQYREVSEDQYIMPGFIDAHVHIESSMVVPSEFARLAVLHGSVATISDPHEIGNVLGKEGVRFMIDNGNKVPFKFYFGAPSCVPATKFETAGAEIGPEDIREILGWEGVNYLAEMMNFPGVLNKDPEVMEKLAIAKEMGKMIDGHLPGIKGEMAKNYAAEGITTDHESFEYDEALDKINYGMKILIREGSAAKNFEALWPLIDEYPDRMMFCSDDKHPNDLLVGHINELARRAVAKGCDVMNVLRMCSYNVVKHYNMNVGLLQEGDPADFCIVKDLKDFEVTHTYIEGELMAENGTSYIQSVPVTPINHFNCDKISADRLGITADTDQVKVIRVDDGQLITKKEIRSLQAKNGYLQTDVEQDVLKLVVVNRYQPSEPARCFVTNFGLKSGAIASSVAHDSHNIIAVGTNDEDLAEAINLLVESEGGVSLANGEEKMCVALPVAGLMSHTDAYEIAAEYTEIDQKARALGSSLGAPYMTLSFCALLVIPELKLSDLGLFDGVRFEFTSNYAEVKV